MEGINKKMEKFEKEITELKFVIKEASEKVSNLENLVKNGGTKYEEKEKLFLELVNGLEVRYENGKINHYNKNGKWVIEEDYKNGYIWFSYSEFWVKIIPLFSDKYIEIFEFLKNMTSKYMKINKLTPFDDSVHVDYFFNKIFPNNSKIS